VREDCCVEAIVPLQCTDAQVEAIVDAKSKWIERAQSYFRLHPATTNDPPNLLIFFGETFTVVSEPSLARGIDFDEEKRVVRTRSMWSNETRAEWQRTFARDFLRERTKALADAHGFSFNRLYVLNQKTVWGNCSKKRNISLNWQLIRAPRFVIDYVILHELLHTRFMSHGQPFWRSVSRLSERYKEAIDWL
jgi:predicted metal-dependent hydrolase